MDCFAVLEQQRRPWLDPEALKQKFLARSAQVHPDLAPDAAEVESRTALFTELNQAYHRLRDPKERLQHLLELETGALPVQVQRFPPELMDLAMQVGQCCRQTDQLLSEKDKVNSPMLQVALFEPAQARTQELQAANEKLDARLQELTGALCQLDAAWIAADSADAPGRAALVAKLEHLYRLFSYCNRWHAQLQERLTRLAF